VSITTFCTSVLLAARRAVRCLYRGDGVAKTSAQTCRAAQRPSACRCRASTEEKKRRHLACACRAFARLLFCLCSAFRAWATFVPGHMGVATGVSGRSGAVEMLNWRLNRLEGRACALHKRRFYCARFIVRCYRTLSGYCIMFLLYALRKTSRVQRKSCCACKQRAWAKTRGHVFAAKTLLQTALFSSDAERLAYNRIGVKDDLVGFCAGRTLTLDVCSALAAACAGYGSYKHRVRWLITFAVPFALCGCAFCFYR